MTVKTVPARADLTSAQTRSVHYSYDLMGRPLTAKFDSANGADGITNVYDAFGNLTSSTIVMGGISKALTGLYDVAGRRTRLTHPDNQAFTYAYDALARLTGVYQGVGTTTALSTFTYTAAGLPGSRSEAAGSSVSYGWDAIGRLTSLIDAFTGTTGNVSRTFTYNPASQVTSETRNNDAYAWTGGVAVNRPYAVNGLNQYTTAGPANFTYDANGNLTSDGTNSYTYDIENRLVKAVGGGVTVNLTWDPLGRLWQVDKGTSSTTTRFLYDGDAMVAEMNNLGTITNRYVHGSNADEPLVWFVGSGLTNKRWLHADHLGSIVAATDSLGGSPSINSYDEYGIPGSSNVGRFQYTGQAWLPELGMYHYKARIYSPTLGRFLQTDPIGYEDQINLYAYVTNDPINLRDPEGEQMRHPRAPPPRDPRTGRFITREQAYSARQVELNQRLIRGMTGEGQITMPPGSPRSERVVRDTEARRVEIETAVKAELGVPGHFSVSPANKQVGVVFADPQNPYRNVRLMQGNPQSSNPAQRKPYVVQMHDGKAVLPNGHLTSPKDPAAHIPREAFRFTRTQDIIK